MITTVYKNYNCLFHYFTFRFSGENSLEYEYDHNYGENQDSVFNHEDQDSLSKRHLETEDYGIESSSNYYGSGYGRQFATGTGVGGAQGGGAQVKMPSAS